MGRNYSFGPRNDATDGGQLGDEFDDLNEIDVEGVAICGVCGAENDCGYKECYECGSKL